MANSVMTGGMNDADRKRLENMEKAFHQLAEGQGTNLRPRDVFAKFSPGGSDPGWPDLTGYAQRSANLSKAYGPSAARIMQRGIGSRATSPGKGIGKGLRDLWNVTYPQHAFDKQENYGQEQLEREHGVMTTSKAAREGIKELDGTIRKASILSENQGTLGSYVVPPDWRAEIQSIEAEDATIEPRCRHFPMTTKTMTLPLLDIFTAQPTGNSPYFGGVVGTWSPEGVSFPQTNMNFKQDELTNYDLVLYMVSSNQLLQDNGVGLETFIPQLIGKAMNWYLEWAWLNGLGAGASMPLGVGIAPATINVTRGTANTIKLADGAAMTSKQHIRSWGKAGYWMHQSCIPQFIQMVDNSSSNRLVWMNPVMPGQVGPAASALPMAFLDGQPIFITEKCQQLGTTGDLRLLDWSYYWIGDRIDIQLAVSDQYLFPFNQLAWRAIIRKGGLPWLQSYITDAQGWTSSPFVQLHSNP